jgi:predicted RNase H-like HicB family nuclease
MGRWRKTIMRIRFEAQLLAGTRRDEEAGTYVCHAPALNLFSQGSTEPEAVRAIESAIRLYLTTAYEGNLLEHVLKGHGFTPSPPEQSGTVPTSADQYIRLLEERHFDHIFDVPTAVDLAHA